MKYTYLQNCTWNWLVQHINNAIINAINIDNQPKSVTYMPQIGYSRLPFYIPQICEVAKKSKTFQILVIFFLET